jgi:outer membrane protein OmpA-like peptidoglycan-associated protein
MNITKLTVIPAFAGLALVSQGCLATRKHVDQQIAPVQAQVNTVQKQTADNKQAIGDLDRQVATTDEKASEAGRKAQEAAEAAQRADDAANQAARNAMSAHAAADQVGSRLEQTVNNFDNYRLLNTEKVFFRLGKYNLTDDEKAKLDQAIQALGGAKNYVIEVEGYTDTTGGKAYNIALSQRRADAVVRYLAVHNVPVRKIHDVGIGTEEPNATNKTPEERKENRRVDVRVYALDLTGAAGQAASATVPDAGANQSGMSDRTVNSGSAAAGAMPAGTAMPANTAMPEKP